MKFSKNFWIYEVFVIFENFSNSLNFLEIFLNFWSFWFFWIFNILEFFLARPNCYERRLETPPLQPLEGRQSRPNYYEKRRETPPAARRSWKFLKNLRTARRNVFFCLIFLTFWIFIVFEFFGKVFESSKIFEFFYNFLI